MLLRFGVSNYRSILERQELSLVATSLKDDQRGLIPSNLTSSSSTVPSAIIYGANASGKSNVLAALQFLRSAVISSHSQGFPGSRALRQAFALAHDSANQPSVLDIDFIVDNVRYHFGFEATDLAFKKEWLYALRSGRRQMLYERTTENNIIFGRGLKGRNRVIADLMRDNSLFISTAIQNNHEELTKVSSFFRSIVFTDVMSVPGSFISYEFKDVEIDQRTINFLRMAGTGVVDFKRVERQRTEEELRVAKVVTNFFRSLNTDPDLITESFEREFSEKNISIKLAHKGEGGEEVLFDPDSESAGTRRLLILAGSIFKALDTGSLMIVDELDASLHTQVCEALVALFSDQRQNPRGAQLVATTHDTNLMRCNILRRDQIWFTEKDDRGATHLFPLSDIQTRKNDNIEKGYLQGRFGAIPFAGSASELLSRQ